MKCRYDEENSGKSMRTILNQKYGEYITDTPEFNKLKYIEVAIDNICNLSCRMCWPAASSRVAKTFRDIGIVVPIEPSRFDLSVLNDIDMSELDHVKILGGEPLYTKRHKELMELLKSKCDTKKVSLTYHTNGTFYNEDIVEDWKNFKHIRLIFSIDGYGKVNDYQRSLSDFESISNNISLYKEIENATISCNSVLTILNIFDLPSLIVYFYSVGIFDYSLDFDFGRLGIMHMSDRIKTAILSHLNKKIPNEDFKKISKMIYSTNHKKFLPEKIMQYIVKTDKYFGTSLKEISPKMYALLNQEYNLDEYYKKT